MCSELLLYWIRVATLLATPPPPFCQVHLFHALQVALTIINPIDRSVLEAGTYSVAQPGLMKPTKKYQGKIGSNAIIG